MELLLILIIVFIIFIFGVGKLLQFGEGIGNAIKGFKKTMHEAKDEAVQHKPGSSTKARKIAQITSVSLNKIRIDRAVRSKGIGWGGEGQEATRSGYRCEITLTGGKTTCDANGVEAAW